MKKLKLFAVVIIMMSCYSEVNAQNRYWVFPPNYVDFYTGQVLPLPNTAIAPSTTVAFQDIVNGSIGTIPGTPLAKSSSYPSTVSNFEFHRGSNGIFKSDGTLDFYLTNTAFSTFGKTIVYDRRFTNELPVMPVPQKCGYYFLVSDVAKSGNTLTISYKEIPNDGSAVVAKTLNISHTSGCGEQMAYAIAPYKFDPLTSTVSSTLYLRGCSDLFEISIQNSGLVYLNTYSTGSIWMNDMTELEISPNGRYLAAGRFGGGVSVFDLTNHQIYTYADSNGSLCFRAYGIEFSPSSNRIFFVNESSCAASIGYFNLDPNPLSSFIDLDEGDITYVPNTSGLHNSMLETAVDGLMYVSDGTSLKGFDPENIQAGIIKTFSIANSATVTPSISPDYYTLVDQIDGADYSNLFRIGCELTKSYSNVTSSNGTLPAITKVAQTITAQTDVTVANNTSVTFKASNNIYLKPGFKVDLGGSFKGKLEYCQDFAVDPCAGGGPPVEQRPVEEPEYVRVYTNPTTGPVVIELPYVVENLHVAVLNAYGKTVSAKQAKQTNRMELDLSAQSNGLYILKIADGKQVLIKKIILSK